MINLIISCFIAYSKFIIQHSKLFRGTICGLEKSDNALDELNRVYSIGSD